MTDGLTTRLDAADEVTWPARPIPSPRRRRNRIAIIARRGGKLVVALVSVAVLTVTWYGWQFIGDPNSGLSTTQVFDEELHAVPLDGAVDILLVGMDSRTDAQGNPLPREVLDMLHAGESDGEKQTDTMILVHIPQDGRRAVAISFPRDSWVELAGGFGKHKLNGAFVYAYNDRFRELQQQGADLKSADEQAKVAGRKNLIATLETFIGKPGMIDRYAEVNLASFYEVTKALGGVEVCLKAPVRERKSGVDLPAGRQTVEGVQALAFVRQRYDLPGGDLDRIGRQQAFLSGLARKMLSRDVLANPGKLSDVITAVKKSVVLSDNWDLPEFAAQMRGLNSGNIEFRTIPVVGNAVIGGADVVRVDPQAVHAFVDQLTSDGSERTSSSVAPTSSASSAPPTSSRRASSSVAAPPSSPALTSSSPAPPPITAGDVPCVN
ncbi:LCP family protein [Amycolatopsis thermoflava]|uniref:LytR family transcriptional attenuator n=1 Tax=Amycolatopsis thermoflava TaxID=84480 RepID=A0A3N2GV31_9PSEU|nr:LCP family protein [Amycolatopsis thermoflava]ROS40150.1 LytR family transcriptional attenuator [Amycolatopsis thermoflava]